MSCIDLSLAPPQIPPIFIGLPAFNFTQSLGEAGISCCKYVFPIFHVSVPIPVPGTIFAEIIAVLNIAIVAGLALLDLNLPSCPRNSPATIGN